METLQERSQDAVLFANDFAKSASLFVMIKIFKQLGPALFKGGDKTVLTSALSAVKIGGLAFGINFVIQPLLAKFNVKPADRTKIIELYAKLVRFGIDYFIGKFGEDVSFEIFFNLLRVDLYHDLLTDFVSNTQPSLDTAAIQLRITQSGQIPPPLWPQLKSINGII